jgi:hypothetical protein
MTHRKIGARETYFPPFVNELFDGPPYWACTFAALLNGANVGFLGNKSPTHDEVRKLAVASGDPTLKRGANSSEMLRAMKVHYNKTMFLESLSSKRAQERLSIGWALVAGVTYGRIPMPWRRHARNFMKGHRITLIGWNGRETWILDPMAPKGTNWMGEKIPWSVIERAWWPGEQLWFAEGMFRTPPKVKVREKIPNGRWSLPSGSRLVLRSRRNPRVVVRKFVTSEPKSGHFDRLVEVILKDGTSLGEFIRISSGRLDGMLIPKTSSLTLNPRPTTSGGSKKTTGTTSSKTAAGGSAAATVAVDSQSPDFLAGRQKEYDAIKKHVGPAVTLPPRPK